MQLDLLCLSFLTLSGCCHVVIGIRAEPLNDIYCLEQLNVKSTVVIEWENVVSVKLNVSSKHNVHLNLSRNLLTENYKMVKNFTQQPSRRYLWKWIHNPQLAVCGKSFTSCFGKESEEKTTSFLPNIASTDGKPELTFARNIMTEAFAPQVWVSIGATLTLISVALRFVLRKEEEVVHMGSENPPWETSEVLLVTLGVICQQGSPRHPDTAAARTIFTFLFAFSVIAFTAYSASVVATLAPPVEEHDRLWYLDHRPQISFRGAHARLMDEESFVAILRSDVTMCTVSAKDHTNQIPTCIFTVHKWCGGKLVAKKSIPRSLAKEKQEEAEGVVSLTLRDTSTAMMALLFGMSASLILLFFEIL